MSIITKIKRYLQKNVKVVGITAAVAIAAGAGAAAYGSASASPVATRDCDNNAVMYCGAESLSELTTKYNNGDGHNKAYAIQDIYNWYGISPSDMSSIATYATGGYVTKDGGVYTDNGTLVATNALTGGRQNIAGSTLEKYGATTFYARKPSVSFLDAQLKAYVVMKNGVFQFAILYSCGNAVKATPVPPKPKPVLTCVQLALTPGAIDSNGDQTYTLEAQANAANGATISSYHFNFGDGTTQTVSSSSKTVTISHKYAPGTWTASFAVNGVQSSACIKTISVAKPPTPKATLTCDELTLTPGAIDSNGDQTYTLSGTASASNATISSYEFNFGDNSGNVSINSGATSISTTHKYAPGTWTASFAVHGTVNGQTLTGSSSNCVKPLTVKALPQGTLTCNELTLTPGAVDTSGDQTYKLEATATPSAQEASITSYTFNFGDNSQTTTVTTGANSASTSHTYAPGNWTTSVTVNGTVNGKAVSVTAPNCAKVVKIGKPVTPVYVCSELTMSPVDQADAQGNLQYSLSATASASNATIDSYTFNFGDNSQNFTDTTSAVTANTTHTYAPGSYTATVSVTFTLANGTQQTVTAASCQAKITVPAVPTPTCTSAATGQTYPAGSSQCQTCTAPSGQLYPVGSAQCTPTPTPPSAPTPTALPNTGPGDVVGLFSGVSMSGAGLHRILGNRRARRAARQ